MNSGQQGFIVGLGVDFDAKRSILIALPGRNTAGNLQFCNGAKRQLRIKMPDTTTDLVALATRVKVLSGDLNRRSEQSNSRIDELNSRINELNSRIQQLTSRIDALSLTEKLAFAAALDGNWVDGTASPQVTLPGGGLVDLNQIFIAGGNMSVILPNLSRIGVFRASVRSTGITTSPCILEISLQRRPILGSPQPVVAVSLEPHKGIANPQGDPIPGTEFVDNDQFKYFVSAELSPLNSFGDPETVQQGMVVLESFQVDCIIT